MPSNVSINDANGESSKKLENYQDWSHEDLVEEIKKLRKRKKYGIVWDEDRTIEKFDKDAEDKLPVLTEVVTRGIVTDKNQTTNTLIEGDNYHALSVLNYTHNKMIDLIYIDPPYNTGNKDFLYFDAFSQEPTEVESDDPYKHSKWLSFMNKRLRLAKSLLRDTGVIFISINEEELSQLKLLCDGIFDDKNYLTMFTVKVRHEDRILKGDKDFHEVVEYLLMYRRSNNFRTVKRVYDNTSIAEYMYSVKELVKSPKTIQMGPKLVQVFKPNQFEIERKEPRNDKLKKISIRGSIKEGNSSGRFYMKYLEKLKDMQGYLFKVPDMGDDSLGHRYFLTPSPDDRLNGDYFQGIPVDISSTKEVPYPNFLDFEDEFNNVGYEGGIDFRNGKKPADFILKIMEMGGITLNKNAIVLDFFAGSGSTGHAVLELNASDQGSRKFILSTNNENGICTERCYPRMINAIKGFKSNRGDTIQGLGGNLKYFKTAFVESEHTDKNKRKLVENSTAMLCLKEDCFELIKSGKHFKIFTNPRGKYLGIVNDDDGIAEFKEQVKAMNKLFQVYIFSLDESAREEEFEDLLHLVNLRPIPEAILNVYRKIFK